MILAANLSWLFTEIPLLDRPRAAAQAGFDAVEVLFPYDTPAHALCDAISDAGLSLVLINTPPGDTMGHAAIPGREETFRHDFALALAYARQVKSPALHVMSGVTSDPQARKTLIENLRWAASEAPDLKLTIEPLNPSDVPGYFLANYFDAADIIAESAAPNLRLQYDAYHAQMIHGDAAEIWRAVGHVDGHVQIAAAPRRSEPDAITLAILKLLKDHGYDGPVSAEYRPSVHTEDSLSWLADAKRIAKGSS